ncbi:MAG: type II secretion system F family protein [Actinomycetota bacterium]|jgi:tight adherence protein C|nr:type II secretion system F family protein [Euzebyaceae bacterium]MDQ3453134.1 type II secretion system F family protein [Actinomycetota bacterium]
MSVAALLAAIASAAAAALAVRLVVPPTPRLAARVRPYTAATRSALGIAPEVVAPRRSDLGSSVAVLTGNLVSGLAGRLGRIIDRAGDEALLLRLRQAGVDADLPVTSRLQAYRLRQLRQAVTWTALFAGVGLATRQGAATVLLGAGLGLVFGVSRERTRVDKAISNRRLRMQVELYTVNQLLAMSVRVGGVVQALQRVVERGRGAVVNELGEVLNAHRGGRRIAAALEQAAVTTPEPHAARTYRLLSRGVEYGTDLAEALRDLSEEIRSERVEALKRTATKRRAAMLVPIIAVLAPVMLLFVAAPLPSIVFGGR